MSLTNFFYEIKKLIKNFRVLGKFFQGKNQRWSRGHKARGQGQEHKKIRGRGQTLSRPRTGMLEAKDTNANVFRKKKVFKNFF